MSNKLVTLSESQLKLLIKTSIDSYLDKDYDYTIKHLSTTHASSTEDKLTFQVEISCKEVSDH